MLRDFALAGARRHAADGAGAVPRDPAPVRDAATVMLVRPAGGAGVEVFTLRRAPRMAFAAGMLAFPGGAVEPADADPGLPWHGPSAARFATALGTADVALARSLVAAAVRETFEECGVLLAAPAGGAVDGIADVAGGAGLAPAWEARRQDLLAGRTTLAAVLRDAGLVLRADLLVPWARWITPPFEPRRFDTRFFVAALPAGRQAHHLTGEAAEAAWRSPGRAVLDHAASRLPMLPPTLVSCEELAAAPSVAALLATRRQLRPVSPWVVPGPDGAGPVLRVDLDGLGGGDPVPWRGGPFGEVAECVLAPNPGPMTLDGTNTWLLAAPGQGAAAVVDPGPDDEGHLAAVVAAARSRGLRVAAILLTHGHADHSAGAARLHRATGAPVRALDPRHALGAEGIAGGAVLELAGLTIEAVATPGHTSDSLSFVVAGHGLLLTGDTVLGRGTTVVAHPDGRLADYLASLEGLERLAGERGLRAVLPGHGPVLAGPRTPPVEVLRGYLRHRRERLDQVRAAVAAGATTARQVVERVYADVPREVWPAAELGVQAQLLHLGVPGAPGGPPVDHSQ